MLFFRRKNHGTMAMTNGNSGSITQNHKYYSYRYSDITYQGNTKICIAPKAK